MKWLRRINDAINRRMAKNVNGHDELTLFGVLFSFFVTPAIITIIVIAIVFPLLWGLGWLEDRFDLDLHSSGGYSEDDGGGGCIPYGDCY